MSLQLSTGGEAGVCVCVCVCVCRCRCRNYLIPEKENQKAVGRKITGNDGGLEVVHVPKPVTVEKFVIYKALRRCLKSLALGRISPRLMFALDGPNKCLHAGLESIHLVMQVN